MPTVTRRRSVQAPLEAVWDVVNDPWRLPGWWPLVTRVEEAEPDAWTEVLASPRGKVVRADFTLVESEPPRRRVWRQEVAESPFERLLAESFRTVELEPEAGDSTAVAISIRHRPRGWARLGFIQLRRATARQAEEALQGLDSLLTGGAA
ncbi:MAG: SRPBCC domain-containing protein [Thermoleophilaceae bacterium]